MKYSSIAPGTCWALLERWSSGTTPSWMETSWLASSVGPWEMDWVGVDAFEVELVLELVTNDSAANDKADAGRGVNVVAAWIGREKNWWMQEKSLIPEGLFVRVTAHSSTERVVGSGHQSSLKPISPSIWELRQRPQEQAFVVVVFATGSYVPRR